MNMTKYFVLILTALIVSAGMFSTGLLQASSEQVTGKLAASESPDGEVRPGEARPGEHYLPSENAMNDLAATMDAARGSGTLVLVVMGANWCHDSRSLALRLQTEPLGTLVDQHYETIFVDVGYLDKGNDVITSLGVPVYYATPTVLIVDPASGQLVNADNRHQWGSADSISMDDSVEYFELMANTDLTAIQAKDEFSEELQALLLEIDAFEQVQADRLYGAYAVLGPMLEAYDSGDKDKFSEKDWNKVRDFRYKVPVDIAALKTEAYARIAAGERNIKLKYPKYSTF